MIWNSDQGSQFTSPQYLALLTTAGVQISMDGKGRRWTTSSSSGCGATVKYEEVYLRDYATPREKRGRDCARYLLFYNEE